MTIEATPVFFGSLGELEERGKRGFVGEASL
jgi:hypothetical protein